MVFKEQIPLSGREEDKLLRSRLTREHRRMLKDVDREVRLSERVYAVAVASMGPAVCAVMCAWWLIAGY